MKGKNIAHYLQGLPSCNTEAKDPVPVPHILHQRLREKMLNAVKIMVIIIYRFCFFEVSLFSLRERIK